MKQTLKKYSLNAQRAIGICALILLATSFGLFAQGGNQVRPKTPEVPDAIKRIDVLMGKWEGTIQSETGPVVTKKELKVSLDFSKMFKNMAVKVATRSEALDTTGRVVEGNIIISYDAADMQMHALMMDDHGEAYSLTGKWMNDYNLNFSCNTERGGKQIGITIWMSTKVPGELGYRMYKTIGEGLLITDEGKLKRAKAEEPAVKKAPVKK